MSIIRKTSQNTSKAEPQPTTSSKTKIVLEPEPRKMQADRPVLLQDLSQSKLLLKFKQEASSSDPKPTSEANKTDQKPSEPANNDSTKSEPKVDSNKESPKQTQPPPQQSKKTSKVNSVASSGQTTPSKMESKFKTPPPLSSGVYGADIYDGGGVYGADIVNVPTKPIVTSSKQSPSQSIDKTAENAKPTDESNNKNPVAKNRKSSKDEYEENENESLINDNVNGSNNENVRSSLLNTENESNDTNSISLNKKSSPNNLETQSTKVIPNVNSTRLDIIDNDSTVVSFNPASQPQSTLVNTSTTPRKPAFNPLHVILKDKNKYHTTEYI